MRATLQGRQETAITGDFCDCWQYVEYIEFFSGGLRLELLDSSVGRLNIFGLKGVPAMSKPFLIVAASLLATTAAQAAVTTTFNGTYSAVDASGQYGPYSPTINDDGNSSFLHSPFSETLTTGSPVTTTFMQVAPLNGGVGNISGSIIINMKLTGPGGSAVTGVTTSAGGNGATLSNGTLDFSANYKLLYGTQTDCLTWNSPSCTPTGNTSTVGETLTVTFADKAVLDINLYNWSDWDMEPNIGFDLISGPVAAVPEPATVAQFGVGLLGLIGVTMRRRRAHRVTVPQALA